MKETIQTGMNRTGVQIAPLMSKEMLEGAEHTPFTESEESALDIRREYIESSAPVGTVPIPGSLKGAASVGIDKLKGLRPEIMIDKLGERLAFERTGTRLYDALILKARTSEVRVDINSLIQIREEELEHFDLLREAMEQIGADPTAQTPCADSSGVASQGLLQVVTDPRTNLAQSLQAVLIAEMADNAGWELLIRLAEEAGYDELAERFRVPLEQEQRHFMIIKDLVTDLNLQQIQNRI